MKYYTELEIKRIACSNMRDSEIRELIRGMSPVNKKRFYRILRKYSANKVGAHRVEVEKEVTKTVEKEIAETLTTDQPDEGV
jgi:hypothetical protein